MSSYKIADVTNDLKFLMTLTDIFGVDDKGFWIDILKDERFKYNVDANDTPKEIIVFQDPLPKGEYYYFNPLAEGLGDKSPATKLYERTVRANFNANLRIAIVSLLASLVSSKEKDGNDLTHVELRMASVPIDKKTTLIDYADEKLIDEVKKIFDRTHENFFSVVYIQAQQTARAHCDVFLDPQWSEKYGADIRKKSILAFKSVILGVLGLEDEKDFSQFSVKYNPDSKSAAKLDTTLRVYHKLYSRFNEILPEQRAIDLGTLNEVIDRLPMAYSIAKHMVQPSLPKSKPLDLSPSDTSHLAGPTTSSGKRMPSPVIGSDRFAQPQSSSRFQPILPSTAGAGGKFKPQYLNNAPIDPTAPLVNMGSPNFGFGGQGGFNHNNRTYFGGGSSFTQPFGQPNIQPGNMFGRPEMTRKYFG